MREKKENRRNEIAPHFNTAHSDHLLQAARVIQEYYRQYKLQQRWKAVKSGCVRHDTPCLTNSVIVYYDRLNYNQFYLHILLFVFRTVLKDPECFKLSSSYYLNFANCMLPQQAILIHF